MAGRGKREREGEKEIAVGRKGMVVRGKREREGGVVGKVRRERVEQNILTSKFLFSKFEIIDNSDAGLYDVADKILFKKKERHF
jgi:hypothetical protein